MEKSLYLTAHSTLQVKRDGPSLWIEQKGQAGSRVPARLIRRVLIKGNVALDAGSLTLFAERGIPVTFLSPEGRPVGTLLGVADGDAQRQARQAAMLADQELRARVIAWLTAWQRGRELLMISRMNSEYGKRWRRQGYRRIELEGLIRQTCPLSMSRRHGRQFLTGALFELTLSLLTAQGWDPHLGVRHDQQPFGFNKDLVEALHADVDRLWLETIGREVSGSIAGDGACWAAAFEDVRLRLERLARLMLSQFSRLLLEG